MAEKNIEGPDIIAEERKRLIFFGLPWTFTKYTLTNKKLIYAKGLLKSTENEILLYRIADITYTRTLPQKLFGLGTITIYSHDKTNSTLEIKNIKNSREFREKISDASEKDRLRMKVYQSELIGSDADY